MQAWRIAVDTGGTFTDCRAIDPTGAEHRAKVLSTGALRSRVVNRPGGRSLVIADDWGTPSGFFTGYRAVIGSRVAEVTGWDPERRTLTLNAPLEEAGAPPGAIIELNAGEEAPVLAARLVTGTPLEGELPPTALRLATTRGTNALLERKGAPVLFLVTTGFADLLEIRDQRRPDLFALAHHKPAPLYDEVIEIEERLDADGGVLTPFHPDKALNEALERARERGLSTAAVALLHSYRNPAHEHALRGLLEDHGFGHISLSSVLAPLIKLLPRAETAVVDAALAPVMSRFFSRVEAPMRRRLHSLHIMTSAGGLEPPQSCHAKDTLLSGPAGGVVGAATVGRSLGFQRLLSFDMGGTSTDVARFDHDYLYRFEQRVGNAHLLAPALKIETVAAGGGSICDFNAVTGLTVGPESAGADPGPACYGKGGPLTLTDVNFLLDRIDPASVSIPFDREAASSALDGLLEKLDPAAPRNDAHRRGVLEGLLEIAVERTADAIRTISVREGADPAEHALLAFGGAGPLHACAVADKLGMTTILVPDDAGILSAVGVAQAVVERFAEAQVLTPLEAALPALPGLLDRLADRARAQLESDGVTPEQTTVRRRIAELRLVGQDTPLEFDIAAPATLASSFATRYADVYGYPPPEDKPLELVSLRVVVSVKPERERPAPTAPPGEETIAGPALLPNDFATVYVAPGWLARRASADALVLSRTSNAQPTPAVTGHEIVTAELFRHRFQNIVDAMGARLQRSALSTNIKERADFSCALLDSEGRLAVNAPHIPVHLGALGLCVREIAKRMTSLEPGDMIVTNHPAFGGSHLPDVTVISPVFDDDSGEIIGWLANRAHHAEIGGITPGSMPPDARRLSEEGVVLPPMHLFHRGEPRFSGIEACLRSARYPSRRPEDNLADLRAQAAANLHGVRQCRALLKSHGAAVFRAQLRQLLVRSRDALRAVLPHLPSAACEETLDDGTRIALRIERADAGPGLRLDFTGSAPEHPGSFNATPAIVRSAVLYALRLFTRADLPLNEGLLEEVEIVLPPGFLNPRFPPDDPESGPAVVAGNVETSQRLVDTILKALDLQACSQGTMNNLVFGDGSFGYYETIAGGAGAGPGDDGASALHTHMTNTAITDPEILENRYPVRLRQFSIRRGSGGRGRHPGGDGVVRELEFLAPLTVSLLTQHREIPPYGLHGGEPGQCGRQTLHRPGAGVIDLPGVTRIEVTPGDRLRIATSGRRRLGSCRNLIRVLDVVCGLKPLE